MPLILTFSLSILPQIISCVIIAQMILFLVSTCDVRSVNSIDTSSLKYRYSLCLVGHFINNRYITSVSDGSVIYLIVYTVTSFLVTFIDTFVFTYSTKVFRIRKRI